MKKQTATTPSTASTLKTQGSFSKGLSSRKRSLKVTKSAGNALALPKAGRSLSSSPNAGGFAESSPPDLLTEKPEGGITRFTLAELANRPTGKTDWAKIDALTDEDIARALADDPDAAPLDLDWSKAKLYYPVGKLPVSLRVDADVFAFFKSRGKGYQTRMNAVLRTYMEHETAKKKAK